MRFLPMTVLLLRLSAVAPVTATAASPGSTAPAAALDTSGRAALAARGFRSRPRTAPARRYAPSRYRSRPVTGRRLFRGVLQALGIAFLVNMLFGWGAGGSPLGLILLIGLVLWFVTRSRRRRMAYARY